MLLGSTSLSYLFISIGERGERGPLGIGITGVKGDVGRKGEMGQKGLMGYRGPMGPIGITGPAGVDGRPGNVEAFECYLEVVNRKVEALGEKSLKQIILFFLYFCISENEIAGLKEKILSMCKCQLM